MKSFLRVFYLLVVALVVFTGALLIAEGAKERPDAAQQAETAEEAAAPWSAVLETMEGRAL